MFERFLPGRFRRRVQPYDQVLTERFTEPTRKAVTLAQEEARHFNHNYIGTEHLLLGLLREDEGTAARVLSNLDVDPDKVRREVVRVLEDDRAPVSPGIEGDGVAGATAFEARVEGLAVHVRCGVSDEERALPQTLLVALEYSYDAPGEDDIGGVVDYGVLLEEAARVLERGEFRLLETGARMVGEQVLSTFPTVGRVTVSVTKLRVPVARSLAGVSVSATFRR